MNNNDKPNWDKITEGKIRHGFAVAAFTGGMKLTEELCRQIEEWVKYVVSGVADDESSDDESSNDESANDDAVQNKGELHDSQIVSNIINQQIEGLRIVDKQRVLSSLEKGNISKENLDACLLRIDEIKESYGA